MDIEHSKAIADSQRDGLHYVNSPQHARAVLQMAKGMVDSLVTSPTDDPALYACEVLDSIGKIAGCIVMAQKWANAVNEATPDQVWEHGAQLCR